MVSVKNSVSERLIGLLPKKTASEINELCRYRGINALREIRLRTEGRASVKIGKEIKPLAARLTREEMRSLVSAICDGAVYAHRESISEGYISMSGGVRVGIVGTARYDLSRIVGVEEISSLVFRIPSGECSFSDELENLFRTEVRRGLLIYSPPGVGKTTALRALAKKLGSGNRPMRVCIIDERFEFFADDYRSCEVDILKGYKKRAGIDIAIRTMSPDVVMIDEIGAGEADAAMNAANCGIPLVATAHARDSDELFSKQNLKPLFDNGSFDRFVGISDAGDGYKLRVDKL